MYLILEVLNIFLKLSHFFGDRGGVSMKKNCVLAGVTFEGNYRSLAICLSASTCGGVVPKRPETLSLTPYG